LLGEPGGGGKVNAYLEQGLELAAGDTLDVYEDEIPAFARPELERLYQSPFASAEGEHVRQPGTHTYVASSGGAVVAVILFRLEGSGALVLNSAVELDAAVLERFAACVFRRYPLVSLIELRSVLTGPLSGRYPSQRFCMSEDIVLSLPASVEAYLERLGKSAAKRMQYAVNRLRREFPGFRHQVFEGAAIDRGLLQSLFDLKARQRASKQETGGLDAAQVAWMNRVAASYGFVAVSTIDGRVCAGSIGTRVGDDFFLHVVTHDPALDAYSIGTANSYLTICAAIERGGRDYHFLWGQGAWKFRFLGTQRELYDLVLYRSRLAWLARMPTVLEVSGRAWRRRMKSGVLDAAARYRPLGQLLRPCIAGWRRLAAVGAPRPAGKGP
jgi:hypothetical protein